jgi:glycosyltransferase involved in cell wall biosynthesis
MPLAGEEIRRQHGVADDTVVILSLSRLVLSKRVDRIIDAMQVARQKSSKRMVLWVVGDGPLRQSLATRARQAGIECEFLGTVSRDEIPHLLDAADVLVSTSILTNMSIPTCEAMVVGTPVIGLDVGGTSEVVRDDETGLLVPEDNPAALAEAIVRICEDSDLRNRLGATARDFAARTFMNWDQRVGAEIETVDRLVQEAQSSRGPHRRDP